MPRARVDLGKELHTKGSRARNMLSKTVRIARERDRGYGPQSLFYTLDRSMFDSSIPFSIELRDSLRKRIANGQRIRVLEKGVGSGKALSDIKGMSPDRIHTTGVAVSNTLIPQHGQAIDNFILEPGITAKHPKKFDIIYDAYGEDYHLPRGGRTFDRMLRALFQDQPAEAPGRRYQPLDRFLRYSIDKSLSHLKKGGELFTIFPLGSEPGTTFKDSERLIASLERRGDVDVRWRKQIKRAGHLQIEDLILHVKKL